MGHHKCCFCGQEFVGFGNNPDCWDDRELDYEHDRCCDECNASIVIPARMKVMFSKKKGD